MTDLVLLLLKAGRGGDGRVSFLRQKYQPKGGPDGGMGGDGGSVLIKLNPHLASLSHLAGVKEVKGTVGQNGGPKLQRGHAGKNAIVEVPPGTHIWQVAANHQAKKRQQEMDMSARAPRQSSDFERYQLDFVGAARPPRPDVDHLDPSSMEQLKINQARPEDQGWRLLGVINTDLPELLVCQGGFGGRGNDSFKSATNRTPLQAEWGSYGEERLVVLEHKLLADVGLVGLPNAGKSTLLSTLTQAKPKIGAYPFTTLEPHLGLMKLADQRELVLADIPGLIEGASQGKGLGHDFLRHIEHCAVLLFVLSPEEVDLVEAQDDGEELARRMARQLRLLRSEVTSYAQNLSQKPWLVVFNKTDLLSPSVSQTVVANLNQVLQSDSKLKMEVTASASDDTEPHNQSISRNSRLHQVLPLSAATRQGLRQLAEVLLTITTPNS